MRPSIWSNLNLWVNVWIDASIKQSLSHFHVIFPVPWDLCEFVIWWDHYNQNQLPYFRKFHLCDHLTLAKWILYGSLTRYMKLRVVHAPRMPRTLFPPPRVSDPDIHHGTCATHVPWCMLGSLTRGFLRSRWRGKRSRHSWGMRNPQFYASGKRPMVTESPTETGARDWHFHPNSGTSAAVRI